MNPKKTIFYALMVVFSGCATHSTIVMNEPVGPDLAPARTIASQREGSLVVYSAPDVANPVESRFPTHSPYEVDDSTGKLVLRVDNRSGSFYQNPVTVSLNPGEYKIKAKATNHGIITVPVIIKEGETTTLDLDGTHFRQHKPTGAGQWIRLPTGEIIGMRAP